MLLSAAVFATDTAEIKPAAPAAKSDKAAKKPTATPIKSKTTAKNSKSASKSAKKAPLKRAYVKQETYFSLPSSEKGKTVDLAAMQDNPVLIAFITTRCPYCRTAMGALNALKEKYGAKGLNVITVAFEKDPSRLVKFAADNDVKFPAALGDEKVAEQYKVRGVPHLYLLDRDHKVATMWMGYSPQYDKEMSDSIEEILAETPSAQAEEAKPEPVKKK